MDPSQKNSGSRQIGCADLFVYGAAIVILIVIGSCAFIAGGL